jgi:hypothetical protein
MWKSIENKWESEGFVEDFGGGVVLVFELKVSPFLGGLTTAWVTSAVVVYSL